MADLHLVNHGSICVLNPLTPAGKEWMNEHLPEDAIGWGPSGIIIEPRYVADIVAGAREDGLEVK